MPFYTQQEQDASGGGHIIEYNGVPVAQREALNFTGPGVTVTDDPGNDATVVTISGGGGAMANETPTGVIDGVNDTFTVTEEPAILTVNGLVMTLNVDYTYSLGTIVFTTPPGPGSVIRSYYNSGGSGGFGFETPIGSINSSNVTFTVTNPPLAVILNGIMYFENDGYTLSGLTITMLVVPVTGSTLRTIY